MPALAKGSGLQVARATKVLGVSPSGRSGRSMRCQVSGVRGEGARTSGDCCHKLPPYPNTQHLAPDTCRSFPFSPRSADACCLALQLAQIIELGTTHPA